MFQISSSKVETGKVKDHNTDRLGSQITEHGKCKHTIITIYLLIIVIDYLKQNERNFSLSR